MQNAVEKFSELLKMFFEDAQVVIDAPRSDTGDWWLDVRIEDFSLTISWRGGVGFGFYLSGDGYGERPSEIYRTAELAAKRVTQLKMRWDDDAGFGCLSLRDLRKLTGTAQKTLGSALRIAQGGISRFENRQDIKLSTLLSYVEAMGGKVEIKVDFPDFAAVVDVLPPQRSSRDSGRPATNRHHGMLNLIAIRADDPKKLVQFYEPLGLEFRREQHGAGPEHYTCASEDSVFEIYPLETSDQATSATRLGFRVKDLDQVIERLKEQDGVVLKPLARSKWGLRAVMQDPAGHKIELIEKA